jgi:hypothetical protein
MAPVVAPAAGAVESAASPDADDITFDEIHAALAAAGGGGLDASSSHHDADVSAASARSPPAHVVPAASPEGSPRSPLAATLAGFGMTAAIEFKAMLPTTTAPAAGAESAGAQQTASPASTAGSTVPAGSLPRAASFAPSGSGGAARRSLEAAAAAHSASAANLAPAATAADADASGKYSRRSSWGLASDDAALHKRRLLAFYTVHAPAKAHSEQVDNAWELFGPRIWDELERKYRGKTVGFRPMPTPTGSADTSAVSVGGGSRLEGGAAGSAGASAGHAPAAAPEGAPGALTPAPLTGAAQGAVLDSSGAGAMADAGKQESAPAE